MGAGKTAAYRAAYKPADERAPSVYSNAKRIAKHPGIAAEVAQLRLRYMPAEGTMEALYQHALATMVDLTNSDDPRTRFAAACWLYQEAKEHKRLTASTPSRDTADRALEVLRGLYQKLEASDKPGEPFVLDVAEENEGMGAKVEGTSSVKSSTVSDTIGADEIQVPLNTPVNAEAYKRVPIPGYYPRRFRTVRVR
jgi:hypothetical protein